MLLDDLFGSQIRNESLFLVTFGLTEPRHLGMPRRYGLKPPKHLKVLLMDLVLLLTVLY
jgi:hypothetical protein